MYKLTVKKMNITLLAPYVGNPKAHPPEQIRQIASSIEAFGFNDPIAVDENLQIIAGHGRLLAAQQLGLEQVPVIQLTHLSDGQKKAYALAHNKLTLNSGWDMDKLMAELEELHSLNFDELELTGFTLAELSQFNLGDLFAEGDANDNPPEKTEVSIAYQNQYGVIVSCDSEAHQQEVYESLSEAGYTCKVVVV